ncbi:MAG: right-handed parallel beta-helix repeat-containing protein, partial [Myxococcaceae bacterium]
YNGSNPNNGACIMMYGSGAVTFEHNEIHHCGSGIFLKGDPNQNLDTFTIRYNLFHNIGEFRSGVPSGSAIIMHVGAANPPDRPTRVYQNVVRDSFDAAIRIWRFSDTVAVNNPMNSKVVNNTFYNVPTGYWIDNELFPNAGHVFRNNLVVNTSLNALAINATANDKTRLDSEHNLFWNFGTFASTAAGNFTLAGWRSTFGQDNASPASIEADPTFVDAAARDFRLQTGSPARTLGRDFLDLNGNGSTTDTIPAGAYLTGSEVIGRTSGPLPPPVRPPSAPSRLRRVTP